MKGSDAPKRASELLAALAKAGKLTEYFKEVGSREE